MPLTPAMFSGGAVRINADRFTQNYMQQIAHENAQKDAAIKYFSELGGRLTPTGMVDEDVHDLINQKNDWQAYNIKNKDKLADTSDDNGAAYMQSMQKYNTMQDLIARSKQKTEIAAKYIKPIISDPKKYDLLADESKDAIHRAGLPVSNPQYKPLVPEDIKFKQKPFDVSDVAKLSPVISKYKGAYEYGKPVQDNATGTQTQNGVLKFSDNDLQGMHGLGAMLYQSNPGFRKMIEDESDPTTDAYKQKNETFRSHTGRDIASPDDLITAHMIEMNPTPRTNQKVGKMTVSPFVMDALRQKDFKEREAIRQGNRVALKTLSRKYQLQDEEGKQNIVNETLNDDLRSSTPLESPIETPKGDVSGREMDVPIIMKSVYQFQDGNGHKVDPDKVIISEDGKTRTALLYGTGKNSDKVIASKVIQTNDLAPLVRNALVGKPKTFGGTPAKPSGKTDKPKTIKQNGFIYTLNPKTGQYE